MAAAASEEFRISRIFDAPRPLVWKAWTEPERLAKWWSPKGYSVRILSLDLKPGGLFHYAQKPANGPEHFGRFIYREVKAPERMVFVLSFCDEKANIVRHPMAPTWPAEMLTTITLADQGGKTLVSITKIPINASDEDRETFRQGAPSMQGGWTGTLDQLAAYLITA